MNKNEKYFFYQWMSINKYNILNLNKNRFEIKIEYYIYTGHTNNLDRRLNQHRRNPRYKTKKNKQLIWIEVYNTREQARTREYEFKNWSKQYKYNSRKHKEYLNKIQIQFLKILTQILFSKKDFKQACSLLPKSQLNICCPTLKDIQSAPSTTDNS